MAGMELPYWRCWAAETLSDSRFQGWDISERGAFWTLLNIQWREGSIPGDLTSLAKLLHVDSGAMRSLWSAIGDRFIPHPDHTGKLANPRMEEEREEAIALVNQKKKAGKLGAESRWRKARRAHDAAMAPPSTEDATPVADDGDQSNGSKGTEGNSSQGLGPAGMRHFATRGAAMRALGGLESPGTPERWPLVAAVLSAVHDRGFELGWPSGEKRANELEQAIRDVTITVAAARVWARVQAFHAAGDSPETTIGWYLDAIRTGPKRGAAAPDAEAVPWPKRLTEEEVRAFCRERHEIAPHLDDAPIGIVGPERELAGLHDKWRAIVEGRL